MRGGRVRPERRDGRCRQDRGGAEPRQGCERGAPARSGAGARDRGRARRHLRAAADGRGPRPRRRRLRLLQSAHRARRALRACGRRRRATGGRRGDRARGRRRQPRRPRACDVRRARGPADGRRRGRGAVRAVRPGRPRPGDRASVRRAVPPCGGVEAPCRRAGVRERPRGDRRRLRDHRRGAPAAAVLPRSISTRVGSRWPSARPSRSSRPARPRCGGSPWGWAGTRPAVAATSTSTRP